MRGCSAGDAELKFTTRGKPVASFSLAVNESFKTHDGEKNDRVEWFRGVSWNKVGEIAGQYMTKGKLVFAEGRLQTRKYDDREGKARKVTEVVVRQLRLLSNGNGTGSAERREAGSARPHTGDMQGQADSFGCDVPFVG